MKSLYWDLQVTELYCYFIECYCFDIQEIQLSLTNCATCLEVSQGHQT